MINIRKYVDLFVAAFRPKPTLEELFLQIVAAQEGLGEVGGNNAGPHVAKFKRFSKWEEGRNLGAWCARGSAWCLEEALRVHLGDTETHPYELAATHVGVSVDEWKRRSRAALGLGRMLRDAFGPVAPSELPDPGMLAIWKRRGEPWEHHVSPVIARSKRQFTVMQFNRGPIVHQDPKHEVDETKLVMFARIGPA